MDFKSRQKKIQIRAGISNRGKEIPNRDRDYKLGQERLQTWEGFSNWGRDYKSLQKTGYICVMTDSITMKTPQQI